MKIFFLLFKKELRQGLSKPFFYILAFFQLLLTGFFFYKVVLVEGEASVISYMGVFSTALIFSIPFFTIRLFSEEKESGALEILIALPIKYSQIILAKFFASLVLFSMILAATLVYLIPIISSVEIGVVLSLYLGVFFEIAALISIGIFFSLQIRSQSLAGFISLVFSVLMFILNYLSMEIEGLFAVFLREISFAFHLSGFFKGGFLFKDLIFFVLLCFLMLFFSLRHLESEKWRL